MSFFKKIKADFEISNLFVDINERDYSIYLNLCNGKIRVEDAIYLYTELIKVSQLEFSKLKQSYNLDESSLAKKQKQFDRIISFLRKRQEQIINKSSLENDTLKK